MNKALSRTPVDQQQRVDSLRPEASVLVQAPAGSGKTDLLTRRFLRLLAEVDDPAQIVAITFTKAAAAEMLHRIVGALEKAAHAAEAASDPHSMEALAARALQHSLRREWRLVELPGQLRITTIDSFCRELAAQQPLLSSLGVGAEIADPAEELYRRAAQRTLELLGDESTEQRKQVSNAVERLLVWRDNQWSELEDQLVEMLSQRDTWMQDFVLRREVDEEALRARLERPFHHATHKHVMELERCLDGLHGTREEAHALARVGCAESEQGLYRALAEMESFPVSPFANAEELEDARAAYVCLADLLLTKEGTFRKQINKSMGFPASRKREKERLEILIESLRTQPELEPMLDAARGLPPARYTDEDWGIVRACFTLLRHAAAELRVVFAEAGAVDFVENARMAMDVLSDEDGQPSDAALAIGEEIRHILVDEFQDTSRRQHQLLAHLIAAWPEREGRSCFAVGDPMQSIYFFRQADAELFPRVREIGLELPSVDGFPAQPLRFSYQPLQANFRTRPQLVEDLNEKYAKIFAMKDGSGIAFASAKPARIEEHRSKQGACLHLTFAPQAAWGRETSEENYRLREEARNEQLQEMVALIRSYEERVEEARRHGEGKRFRVAVLARAKKALLPIAAALREAGVRFRAVDLENLAERQEVLDALALARATLHPMDRVAWLGVLRAPWCGLSLTDLHIIASTDDAAQLERPMRVLLRERASLLSDEGQAAARRVLHAMDAAQSQRTLQPTWTLGTFLEHVWVSVGGADCVNAEERANVDLLWSCLDELPGGEAALPGAALDAALRQLNAMPDPEASADAGVQLMSIHKSKGLEFEVVIVPELQSKSASGSRRMLSWLERGLAEEDESGAITEFLIAPMQPKGDEAGSTKRWVDAAYRERERQEMRRILYVAATRAREELHWFARPTYKTDKDGNVELVEPANSLLATAWPALEEETRARFDAWKAARSVCATHEGTLETLAASGENVVVLPVKVMDEAKPTRLRRLPAEYAGAMREAQERREKSVTQAYARHEGGLASRALGTAVHACLEAYARLRTGHEIEDSLALMEGRAPRWTAEMRALGMDAAEAKRAAMEAMRIAKEAATHPIGAWILGPRKDAESEAAWTGVAAGGVRTMRVDRVFRAGEAALSEDGDCWWIVDYKTTDVDAPLTELRALYAPQLEAYAAMLRNLRGSETRIRAGLFYARRLELEVWKI